MDDDSLAVFNQLRPLLFSIAYRMLGGVMDAEDMVQETFLRWQAGNLEDVKSPKVYLSTIITRLCINHCKSARSKRQRYVGPWLPEPLVTASDSDRSGDSRLAESLSMAFLILLENLAPVERTAFLLREVFDYEYAEIAQILDKTEANCRQLLRRARQSVAARRPRFEATSRDRERLADQFVKTSNDGDLDSLVSLLSADVTLCSDGGGKARAALRPIQGAENVARFILGSLRKFVPGNHLSVRAEINQQPGIITYVDNQPISVVILDIHQGHIRSIYIVTNPDKLAGLPTPSLLGTPLSNVVSEVPTDVSVQQTP
jgi:RNA polymerase sigma-70 factor, ECF subfamily